MVVLVADHPPIVMTQLKISLPETIVMFSLETFGSPSLSRLDYRVVQACFANYRVDLVMVNSVALMSKVTSYLVGSPLVAFS